MSRKYPRFLYSDPQNTKSGGPFITQTLEPRIICRVHKNSSEMDLDEFMEFDDFALELLSPDTDRKNDLQLFNDVHDSMVDMGKWFNAQLLSKQIIF